MWQAFVILLREGFEAFLSVAVITAYLRKTGREWARPAVWCGLGSAVALSIYLGYLLSQNLSPLLEGILGVVAMALVVSFVIHVWRTAHRLRHDIETRVEVAASSTSRRRAFIAVFLFTALMVTREGMEAAMLLILVRNNRLLLLGALLGILAAVGLVWLAARLGRRISVRRFLQATGLLLLLFALQIGAYAFHELTEAGVLPSSESLSAATEPLSPEGMYGKWMSLAMVAICVGWVVTMTWLDRRRAMARVLRGGV